MAMGRGRKGMASWMRLMSFISMWTSQSPSLPYHPPVQARAQPTTSSCFFCCSSSSCSASFAVSTLIWNGEGLGGWAG